ncbi:MAG: PQQ-binding-like beta-propeller repeat protein [Candidatus Aenigmarchaeota archaeon]|nr:PQQ-binding-like beta-propeller repeat protein [Candidatus Aenigmarchaeota archaeon]
MDSYGTREPLVTHTIDPHLGEVQLAITLFEYTQTPRDFWERVGEGGSVSGRALVDGGSVYIGACDQTFYCLDAATGEERWRFPTNGVIMEGAAAGETMVFIGSADGNLYALDRATGQERWRFHTDGIIPQKPLVHQGRVYVGSTDRHLYCLDERTGKLHWRFAVREGSVLEPLIVGDRIFFCAKDRACYCATLDGTLVWTFTAKGNVYGGPLPYANGRLFLGSWDHQVYCLDASTGRVAWSYKTGGPTTIPTVRDGKVYVGSWDDRLYCLDEKTGKALWSVPLTGHPSFQTPVVRDTVVVGTYDHAVMGLDARTGKRLWRYPTRGMVMQLVATDDRIYAGCWDCHLYCLDTEGRLVWKFKTSLSSPSMITPPETAPVKGLSMSIAAAESEVKGDPYRVNLPEGDLRESIYNVRNDYSTRSPYATRKR